MNENDDLRQLFADATSDIRPQGSLDDILDRSKKVDPMTRRWFLPVVAAAAVIGLAIGGAAWLANDSGTPKGDHDPAGTPTATATTGAPATPQQVPVYFVGDSAHGPKLYEELQLQTEVNGQPLLGDLSNLWEASAVTAVGGTPNDPDLRNAWPTGAAVASVKPGETLTIDLSGNVHDRPAGLSRQDAELAIQALVHSAIAGYRQAGDWPVQLTLHGEPTDTVLGVPTSEPITSDPNALAPVQITSPSDGAAVRAGDLTVTGVAATFEANVLWELRSGGDVGSDVVVQQGHTTAKECCTLAPYSFTIKDVQPGSYTLVVHDEDMSGEGRPVNQDTKEIVVE